MCPCPGNSGEQAGLRAHGSVGVDGSATARGTPSAWTIADLAFDGKEEATPFTPVNSRGTVCFAKLMRSCGV